MTDYRIAFIFASRSRPIKFFSTLENIRKMSNSKNYFVLAKLDEDDATMNTKPIRDKLEKDYKEVTIKWGLSNSKVRAINRSMEDLPECDILVVQSDDMAFLVKGFDTEIRSSFNTFWPNLDGVVHYPDSYAKNRTMTMTMMGINLYKQLGYLYHPDFLSIYCDNHLTEMTKQMGKYVFVDKKILEHYHPIARLSDWDEQYRHTESSYHYKVDRETFLRLKANNFGL